MTTLKEVKNRCIELTTQFGDGCCNHCEFTDMGCCDSPDTWDLPEGTPCSQPNWEAMFKQSEAVCRDVCMKLEETERKARLMNDEIVRLRTIVGAVETMIGRKFEV